MKIRKIIFLILFIALNAFIIVNALLPGAESSKAAGPIVETIADAVNFIAPNTISKEPIPNEFISLIRKLIGHFGLFFIDGVITFLTLSFFKNKKNILPRFIYCLFFGLLIATLSELLQLIPVGRSCEINDMLIDFLGFFLGSLFVFVIFIFAQKKQAK